jgi:hypothetical protein
MRTLPLAALAATLALAAPANAATATFLAALNSKAHTGPAALVAGSYLVDNVQWGDVAVANLGSGDISFLPGMPFGDFSAPINRRASSGPVALALGPADADNDINLAIANRTSNSFGMVTDLQDTVSNELRLGSAGTQPSAIATNYFDIAVANEGSDDITYAAGDGFGNISTSAWPAGDGPSGIAVSDLNNDSVRDVVVSNRNGNDLSLLVGQPNPNPPSDSPASPVFAPPVSIPAGAAPSDVVVAQLDRGGRPDLIVPNETAGTVSVLLGTGTGNGFGPPVPYRVGSGPTAVAVGDVNNDGKADVVVANSTSNSVSLLQGNGNGTLGAARSFRVHTRPSDVAILDLNQDGAQDLVTSNAGSNDVSSLLQSPAAIASCHRLTLSGKGIVSCGLRVSGSTRPVRAVGQLLSGNGKVRYAQTIQTINVKPNATSTMRIVPRGKLPSFFNTVVTFSIPGAPTRRVSQYVYQAP